MSTTPGYNNRSEVTGVIDPDEPCGPPSGGISLVDFHVAVKLIQSPLRDSKMGKLRLVAALNGLLAIAFACSCSSSTPPVSVQVSASATQTDQGKSVIVTATVTNDSSAGGVSWTLNGPGALSNQVGLSVVYDAPPANGSGVQTATIAATSVADNTKTAAVKITINPPPTIATGSLPAGSAGTAFSQMVGESGGTPPFAWSIASDPLPNGLSLAASTGTISGTPAEGGTWYFFVQLTDGVGVTAQSLLSIEITPNTPSGNPVPFLNQPLVPDAVSPGGSQFTLTANGTGFLPTSTVNFNGAALATTFVSNKQLTAVVPAAEIATAATASITVVNPSPGGGSSNVVYFPVSTPEVSATLSPAAGSPISIPLTDYIATGNFRGQGRPDLAIGQNGPEVDIYLANGDGTFTQAPGSPVIIPQAPWGVQPVMAFLTTGDFNNSGKLGLAAANPEQSNVPILLGNGDGTFTIPTSFVYSDGLYTNTLAVGDFLGNGNLDLAVANSPSGLPIDIVLGCGDGRFNQGPVSANASLTGAYMPAVGDFNGDGKLDIAVTGGGYAAFVDAVTILLGNGDGTFSLAQNSTFATGSNPWPIVAADFNGDGNLDLAVANLNDATLTILLGNGDGTFTPATGSPVAVGGGPDALATADLNSDGKLDLVVANQNDGTLTILLGNGDGTFTPATGSPIAVGGTPNSVAVGDFNSGGRLGIAVATGSNVIVLVQQP
jgi:FG-GAP-like repeat/Putative Ig domain